MRVMVRMRVRVIGEGEDWDDWLESGLALALGVRVVLGIRTLFCARLLHGQTCGHRSQGDNCF